MELTDKLITLLKRGVPLYATREKSFSKKDVLEILEECLIRNFRRVFKE